MADYTPHTPLEIRSMLDFLGLDSLDDLFAAVPAALRLAAGLNLAAGLSEPDVADRMKTFANRNRSSDLVCFAGGGAYDHEIPAATRALAGRSEWVTAYTPYQAEVSQGVLQALFEYQTMVSRLAGLDIANSSLYDGASALVEAVNLAAGATGRQRVLLSAGVNPRWRDVLATFSRGTGHALDVVPLSDGATRWPAGEGEAAAVVVAYPNYLGCIEDMVAARAAADRHGARLIVAFDPVLAGILRSPGDWGADVAVAEGQPLGTALSFGGPYLGLFACRLADVRRLPGRLVGETVDAEGQRAYVTTLRPREQDIRRERATSNVCTNQTLMAVTAAIQLGWLGTAGLAEVGLRCAQGTHYCRSVLLAIDGVTPLTGAPTVREFSIRTPVPADVLIARLAEEGYLAGVAIEPELAGDDRGLLVAVTERRTKAEIDAFGAAFEKVVR